MLEKNGESLVPGNRQVSSVDNVDKAQTGEDTKSTRAIVGVMDGVLEDTAMDSVVKAERLLELSQALLRKQEEWKNKSKTWLKRIERELATGGFLDMDDLRFLYQTDGSSKDLDIDDIQKMVEIKKSRNIKLDVCQVLGCLESEISITQEEAMSGKFKYYYGVIYLNELKSVEGLVFPEIVIGDINLFSLEKGTGLFLPKRMSGALILTNLGAVDGINFPEYVGDDVNLYNINSAQNVKFPNYIGGDLNLSNLRDTHLFELPAYVGGEVILFQLSQNKKEKLKKKYPHLKIV